MNVFSRSSLLLLAFSFAACGGSSSAGSCAFTDPTPGYTTCEDFVGSGYTTTAVQSDCSRGHGTYAASACPTAGALGTCAVLTSTAAAGTITYYATDAGTATTDEQGNCTNQGGTWTAG